MKSVKQNRFAKWISFACALTTSLCLASGALAYSDKNIQAPRAGEVTIDGDLTEWDTSSAMVANAKEQVVRDVGQWTGPEDCAIEVYLMWDEENLYLAAAVQDDTPFMYREGFPPDMADTLVMFLSTNPDDDPSRTEYTAGDFRVAQIIDDYYYCNGIDRSMIADNKGFETVGDDGDANVIDGLECAIQEIEGGYTYESKIPLKSFSNDQIPVLVPAEGVTVGFEVGMFDLDFPCPGVATVRIEAAGTTDVDVNPSLWGSVTFVEK